MKKFIIKTSFFTLPLILFYFISVNFAIYNEGDLIRIGFLFNDPSPKSKVNKPYNKMLIKYKRLTDINLTQQNETTILSIGDSFSQLGNIGYLNFLAHHNVSVLNVDGYLTDENPVQTLVNLINSDFFNRVHPKYVVLQSVEREIMERTNEIDYSASMTIEYLKTLIHKRIKKESEKTEKTKDLQLFSDGTIKIPILNLLSNFFDTPIWSQTYKMKTTRRDLFSNNPDHLLFYNNDVRTLGEKNDPNKINVANANLNTIHEMLAKKNIKLIVLISPDKYDLYHPYLSNNTRFAEPVFFPLFNNLNKKYIYINSYKSLCEGIKNTKDIYYYDDSHWSPIGSKIIANEIFKVVNEKR